MSNKTLLWMQRRWRLLVVLLTPLVLLPLPIAENSPQGRCGYIILIIAIFWIFEVLPLAVTSLLAIVFFPLAGILEAKVVAPLFFQEIIALFFGSLALAYAIEAVNLHRRIALFVLSKVGTSTKWGMGGLMFVTAFLSMWINNSAATSIMLPVALAICAELERYARDHIDQQQNLEHTRVAVNNGFVLTDTDMSVDSRNVGKDSSQTLVVVKTRFHVAPAMEKETNIHTVHKQHYDQLRKGFLLAVAYSATIGGLSTLVGTGTNVYVKGFVESQYKDTNFSVNFVNFLGFGLPVAVIMLIACWTWLQVMYNHKELFQCHADEETRKNQANLKNMLLQQYKALEKPKWSEYCVGIVFVIMIVLWITKDFPNGRGWDILFEEDYIGDGTVAMFCGLLPLILPNANPFQEDWTYQPIIEWNNLVKHISWSAMFLLGASLSIAAAFTASGLSNSVAKAFEFLDGVPQVAIIFIVILVSGLFTEVTSNLSTVGIFLPVLDAVARSQEIHPGFLILPCTLAVSLAFMLPIATPPNAIVFSSGALKVIDMIKTGIVMNIIGFMVILLASTTWMPKIFGLDDESTRIFYSFNFTTTAKTML